jgi:hypothetical protein
VKKSVAGTLCPGKLSTPSRTVRSVGQDPGHVGAGPAGSNWWRNGFRVLELALDADASPASVLPTETDVEADECSAQRRTTMPSLFALPPCVIGRLSMAAQQSLGSNQKGLPTRSRDQTTEGRDDHSICRPTTDTCGKLPFEDTHLMSEHHALDVPAREGHAGWWPTSSCFAAPSSSNGSCLRDFWL